MQLDLDFFKEVNDTLGHAAGDHILNRVSEVLRAAIRKGDWATRTGGDEFVLIFDGLVHRGELENVASRIIQQLEVPVIWEAGTGDDGTPATVRISGSIGIAVRHDHDVCDAALMMETADRATYAAKAAGRGCARFASLEGSAKAD